MPPPHAAALPELPSLSKRAPTGRDTRHGWQMLACFVVAEMTFVAASVVAVLPFLLAIPHGGPGRRLPGAALVAALALPPVAAGLVAALGGVLLGRGQLLERLRGQLSVRWRLSDVGIGLALGVFGLVITVPASALWARCVGESHANSAVGEVFHGQRLTLGWGLTLFFAVWLIAPLCEELLYRGLLWRAMEYWRWNRWVIAGLTTVLFALAHPLFSWSHIELLRSPLLVVITLPIALGRLLTGNLLTSIIAHQTNNLLPAIGLLLITQGAAPGY
ncbi:MAG: CPBP family intramembrane metalloprotease [Actinomycetota bacterium]|nr:CPBP family intramembrane metalloprotease [Actinomycetota bacterium]